MGLHAGSLDAPLPIGLRTEPCFEDRRVGEVLALRRLRSFQRTPPLTPDIDFLARHGVPEQMLRLAAQRAVDHVSEAREELFALGFGRERYWELLARDLGLPFIAGLDAATPSMDLAAAPDEAVRRAEIVKLRLDGRDRLVLAPGAAQIVLLRKHVGAAPELARRMAIAPRRAIRAFLVAGRQEALLQAAVHRLAVRLPSLSASPQAKGHRRGPPLRGAAALGVALAEPEAALLLLGLAVTALFLNCSFWKAAAALRPRETLRIEPPSGGELPSYSVLVPLYREEAVIPDLVRNLAALDYPGSKLQILILLEADDAGSREAVLRHANSPSIEIIAIPPGGPRTKPNALNYGLAFACGDYVVVFDAEDRPEPDQLRKAAAVFRERPWLGCVQAPLQPDNRGSLLARLFAVEYAANFEVLLPTLAAIGLPLPLGGTSNHFPRPVLEAVGGWDPFNVTEDADLGIRLARFGLASGVVASHTYEEAPEHFRQWLPQRRRWVKGWLQTSLICLRRRSDQRLSLRESLAVHGVLSAGVLGLLLYPLSWPLVIAAGMVLLRDGWPDAPLLRILLLANAANFAVIFAAAALSALRGLREAGQTRLAWLIPLLPLYWMLMSIAAWQALFQLLSDPCRWEKTTHGVARRHPSARRWAG
jgi:cellulose synthase/poly-beta-1,6-N-acetylglucosamine synthase-like glycosyltransferase